MRRPAVRRLVVWGLASAALAAVFATYLSPQLAFALVNQLWNCL